jgi:hypothetical protein
VVQDNLALLLKIYRRPRAAMSDIMDGASLLFAALAVLGVSALAELPARAASSASASLTTLFALGLLYVPAALLLATLFESIGSFGVAFRRDYGPLLVCTLLAARP